jgi:excisionase family DNA binding protein
MAVVTISRELGAGGDVIGQAVALELGVPYYDKEIIGMTAARLGLSEAMIETQEGDRSLMHRVIGRLLLREPADADTGGASLMDAKGITSDVYRQMMEEVVRELAAGGRAVIAGWGGQVILRRAARVLHVHIGAPPSDRAEHLVRDRSIDRAEAARRIAASDAERAGYVRTEYGVDWRAPDLYDLVVNTGRGSGAAAIAAIVAAARALDATAPVDDDSRYRRLRQAYYTVAEAADLLMLNPEVIRHAVYGRELPAERVGPDLLLIDRRDLLAWLGGRGQGLGARG